MNAKIRRKKKIFQFETKKTRKINVGGSEEFSQISMKGLQFSYSLFSHGNIRDNYDI